MDWEIQISLGSSRDERRDDLSRNGWNSGGHLEGQKRGTNVPQIAPQLTRFVSVQGFPQNCAILHAQATKKPQAIPGRFYRRNSSNWQFRTVLSTAVSPINWGPSPVRCEMRISKWVHISFQALWI